MLLLRQRRCYSGSMTTKSLTVRDLPLDAHAALAARAAAAGQSLQEFVRGELVRLAARPSKAEVMERARRRAEHALGPGPTREQIVAAVREGRDE